MKDTNVEELVITIENFYLLKTAQSLITQVVQELQNKF